MSQPEQTASRLEPERSPLLAAGEVLGGRFRILRCLGCGGMGEVYEAQDQALGEQVALKTIRPEIAADERTLGRFKQEIQLARKVTHPNVCRIFDLGSDRGLQFLTMELLAGETLGERLRRQGPMTPEEALPLVEQVVAGLEAAHQAGVIHRDLKSANVMLVESGAGAARAVVTDFGLARTMRADSDPRGGGTLTGGLVGTPAYIAPEQLEGGSISAAVDIYALGVVLYEMMTGRRPFEGDSAFAVAVKRLREPPPSPRTYAPDLDRRWEAAILRCLERRPERRFARASEVAAALAQPAPAEASAARKALFGWWAGTVALVLLALLAGVFWQRVRKPVAPSAARSRRSVAVLGFKNLSGQAETAWISTALAEMLTTELTAGEKLRTIPGENVGRMKVELALAETDGFAGDTLGRIRKNLGADFVVLGSYLALGQRGAERLRIDVRLQDTASGETLSSAIESGNPAELPELVARAGSGLREKLGAGARAPLALVRAAVPAQPEAARLYAQGLEKLRRSDALAARDLLERAARAEPQHPLVHAALAAAWSTLDYDGKARQEAERAFELSAGLGREERLLVEARYREAAKQWDKAAEIYRTLFGFFPDDLEYGLRLASVQTAAGKGKEALATVEALRKLPAPASADARIDLAEASAARSLSDWRRQQAGAARAGSQAAQQGARLLVVRGRLLEGMALDRLGRREEAAAAYEEARRISTEAGDRGSVARALNSIGILRNATGNRRALCDEHPSFVRLDSHKKLHTWILPHLGGRQSYCTSCGSRKTC